MARNLLPNSDNSDPANHSHNKAQPAQSPFVYEPSATFKRKLKVEKDFKNWWRLVSGPIRNKGWNWAVSGPLKRLANGSLSGPCHLYTAESMNCSLFKNLEKHFCNLTYKKKFVEHIKIYRKNLLAIIYRLPIFFEEIKIYRHCPRLFLNYRYRFSTERLIVPNTECATQKRLSLADASYPNNYVVCILALGWDAHVVRGCLPRQRQVRSNNVCVVGHGDPERNRN